MKRILDKSIINELLKKDIEGVDLEGYYCNMELLYNLDLSMEECNVISEFTNRRRKEMEVVVIDNKTTSIKGVEIKFEFKGNSDKCIIYFGSEKLTVYRTLFDSIIGIALDTDKLEVASRIYEYIDIFREYHKKKCRANPIKVFNIVDSQFAILQEIVLIGSKDKELQQMVRLDCPYIIDYTQFNYRFKEGNTYIVFATGMFVKFQGDRSVSDVICTDINESQEVNILYSSYYDFIEKYDIKTISYVLGLPISKVEYMLKADEELRNRSNNSDEASIKFSDLVDIKSHIGNIFSSKDYLEYKIKEFENLKF